MTQNCGELSQKEKIDILMKEYDALRAEISSRTGYGMQVWAIAAAAITWLLGQSDPFAKGHILGFVAIAIIMAWLTRLNVRDIWKCAIRCREIEHEVNSRAGEHLLVWERLFGPANMSFLAGLVSPIRPLPRSSLPPLDPSFRKKPPPQNSN